jgi:hypothetical protein
MVLQTDVGALFSCYPEFLSSMKTEPSINNTTPWWEQSNQGVVLDTSPYEC